MPENKQKYVTIGIPEISKDIFRKVIRPLNNYGIKPNGGLWASRFVSNICCISDWHEYLLFQSDELAYTKNVNIGCIFTLKDDAKILKLETKEDLLEVQKKYPSHYYKDEIIPDYEKISKDYDALFLEYDRICFTDKRSIFKGWDVNTLLLFNLDCIEEYQTIEIYAKPQDYDCTPYITNTSSPKQVEDNSNEYNELHIYIEENFNSIISSLNINYQNYDEYFDTIINCINLCIAKVLTEKTELIEQIKNNLNKQKIKTDEKTIARNIATSILSNYLIKNNEKTKKLKRINKDKIYQIIE